MLAHFEIKAKQNEYSYATYYIPFDKPKTYKMIQDYRYDIVSNGDYIALTTGKQNQKHIMGFKDNSLFNITVKIPNEYKTVLESGLSRKYNLDKSSFLIHTYSNSYEKVLFKLTLN